ncbi:MAG: Ig-like domain-containing protein [Patescibacteria group bacterium]
MNTNVALGIVGGIILAVVGFFIANHPQSPEIVNTAPAMTGTSSQSGVIGAPAELGAMVPEPTKRYTSRPAITVTSQAKTTSFDNPDSTTTESHPTLTGKANIKSISVIIVNSDRVGICAGWDIAVENGVWNYTAPIELKPGAYTLQLLGGDTVIETSLTVKS